MQIALNRDADCFGIKKPVHARRAQFAPLPGGVAVADDAELNAAIAKVCQGLLHGWKKLKAFDEIGFELTKVVFEKLVARARYTHLNGDSAPEIRQARPTENAIEMFLELARHVEPDTLQLLEQAIQRYGTAEPVATRRGNESVVDVEYDSLYLHKVILPISLMRRKGAIK